MREPGNATLLSGVVKRANQEIGGPSTSGTFKWHSRGYLPHFDGQELTQHVTFHLADSLPKTVVERMEDEIRILPIAKQNVERRKRVEDWIDSGHGCCILREPSVASMVQGALQFFDGQRYRLLAWVIMPNHVHVLFQPLSGWTVARIVASWKKFTARGICDYRRSENANQEIGGPRGKENRASGTAGNTNLPIGVVPKPVWHREYWDRFIRDNRHFHQAVQYIHENPVKAGLVARAEDWPWSSASARHQEANQEIGVPGEK